MAISAWEAVSPEWVTSIYDEEEDEKNKTGWKVGPLNQEQLEEVLFGHEIINGSAELSPNGVRLALKYGLHGWRNFNDGKGEVEFSPMNFRRIPVAVRSELAWVIIGKSRVRDDEAKN